MNYKELKEKFNEVFENDIKPYIFGLEQQRIIINRYEPGKKAKNIFLWMLIGIFVFAIIQFTPGCVLCVLALILYSIITTARRNMCPYKPEEWRATCKKRLFLPILSIFGKFTYSANSMLFPADIHNLGLFRNSTRMKDDDVIIGKINGMDISIVETRLYHIVRTKDRSREVTDFDGLIIKLPINKKFHSHSVIYQRNISYDAYINMLEASHKQKPDLITDEVMTKAYASRESVVWSMPFSINNLEKISTPQGRTLEKVKLEDPKFDKLYGVYSDDQVEARYLITPAFMERLNNISNAILVLESYCVFKDGNIYIFISNNGNLMHEQHGFFEIGDLSTSLYDKKCYRNVLQELISIFGLISYFKIDQKLL